MAVTPYGQKESKKDEVREMFDHIAPTYDFLNHVLSLNIDRVWRRKTIREAGKSHPKSILDVATGTADLAIAAHALRPDEIYGIDLSPEMLKAGQKKVEKRQLESLIHLQVADAENLPFEEARFDVVMVAFGVRNFENTSKGIAEMYRVLKPGGKLLVLEFTTPRNQLINFFYQLYFRNLLPVIGKIISKDFSAYRYLPESVAAFPQWEAFVALMNHSGFSTTTYTSLTLGISALYSGVK